MRSGGLEFRHQAYRCGLLVGTVALFALLLAPAARATFPTGRNGKLAFDRWVGGSAGATDIFVMQPDGSAQTNLTNTPAPVSESEPAFSPGGRRIAFQRYDGVQTDIWTMNADGSGAINLTRSPQDESAPDYSPDGSHITFTRFGSQADIWVMNPDGSGQVDLTNTPAANEILADYSPTGMRITYQSRASGKGPNPNRIYAMNADGSGQGIVSDVPTGGIGDEFPNFSPDGRRIVFSRDQDNIFVMNADGTTQTNLTNTTAPVYNHSPIFSPDGNRIAFHRGTYPSGEDVWLMYADGSGAGDITPTPDPADEEGPMSWENLPSCAVPPRLRFIRPTIFGDDGPDRIKGTRKRDVVDAFAGRNVIKSRGGNDLICVGPGRSRIFCGTGRRDKVIAFGKGKRIESGCERIKGKGLIPLTLRRGR